MARTLNLTVSENIVEGTATQVLSRIVTATDPAITSYVDDVVIVAGSVTDQVLSLASLGGTAKYLMLTFDGALSFKFNSTGNAALAFAANGIIVLALATLTNLYVTNAGTTAVNVKRVAALS